MLTNDIKKGTPLLLTGLFGMGNREGVMADNAKGIIRMVEIKETNGHYPDIGSVYIDEILEADGNPVEIAPAHKKKLEAIRASGF